MTDPSLPELASRRPTGIGLRWVVGVAVVLVMAAMAWVVLAQQSRAQVSVLPESLVCNGKPVPYKIIVDGVFEDAPYPAFDFNVDPKTRCVLTVVVSNEGSRPVKVHSVYFELLAPGEGGPVLEVFEGSGGVKPRPADAAERTAAFDVGEKLSGGESTRLQFGLRTRSGVCGSDGVAGFPNRPSATVSAYWLTGTVKGDTNLQWDQAAIKDCN